jgi:tetratricopeptide (TPR) repeat protein
MPQGSSASPPEKRDPDRQTGSASAFLQQALDAYRSGKYGRAERILGQIVEQRPQAGAAWHLRGLNAAASGNQSRATNCFLKAVGCDTGNEQFCASLAGHLSRIDLDRAAVEPWQRAADLAPDNGVYHAELAYCLSRLGRHRDALPSFEAATRLRPDDAPILAAYGTALLNLGDRQAALVRLCRAFEASPQDGSIAMRFGYALQQAGKEAEAVPLYEKALTIDTNLHEARVNLSVCLRTLGDTDAAIAHCRTVLEHRPDSVGAMTNLGTALCEVGRNDEAIVVFERALRHDPQNLTALHNLGVALDAQGASDAAEACFRKCLALRPDWGDAQRSLANLLRGGGRLDEAAALYRAVIDSRPRDFTSYGNLGLVLLNLNRAEEAIGVYEKAVALQPALPDLRFGLGAAQLTTGDFANGWANYEARLDMKQTPDWRPGHGLPRWRGAPDSEGGARPTVIVHAEQGFGDSIHFCRYIPLAAARGASVVFECQPSLAALMKSLAPCAGLPAFPVLSPREPLPPADFHVPLLSLPGMFTPDLASIPARVPYLTPPPDKAATWADRLPGNRPSAGIVWAGNPQRQDDRLRSCPPDALAPILAVDGIDFFGLQKGPSGDAVPGITDLGPLLEDFGDTAAVIQRLDLVITVDTAVAHLAGALGKPVWVMLGHAADWRYLLDRDDSPWYPTMRLFRQVETGAWQPLTERIAQALRARFSADS